MDRDSLAQQPDAELATAMAQLKTLGGQQELSAPLAGLLDDVTGELAGRLLRDELGRFLEEQGD